jgi:hypothetical protein
VRPRLLAAAVALTAAIAVAGCGGSSKPGYCSARTNLENSIKDVSNLSLTSGVSGLQATFQKVQSDATAVVNSAKSDFPTETSAITTSINTLQSAVKALPSSPTPGQIASVATDAAAVVSSVKTFLDASASKCK